MLLLNAAVPCLIQFFVVIVWIICKLMFLISGGFSKKIRLFFKNKIEEFE